MLQICVFGLGYVGSVTAAMLAKDGHTVVGLDPIDAKVLAINSGRSPMREPGLEELIQNAVDAGRLRAAKQDRSALAGCDLVVICVGTPADGDGGVDLRQLDRVVDEIREATSDRRTPIDVINRSTIPPAAHRELSERLASLGCEVHYVVYPEFLREGTAIADSRDAPHHIFGASSHRVAERIALALCVGDRTVHFLSIEDAAMLKYANNCFHALKIAFANEIARLSRLEGADGKKVMQILASDTRLNASAAYLRPGAPFGGSCLGKDLKAVQGMWARHKDSGLLLDSVLPSNERHLGSIVEWCERGPGPIGIYGLAFKSGTDDLRESPSIALVHRLLGRGREVVVYDPLVNRRSLLGENQRVSDNLFRHHQVVVEADLGALCAKSSRIVVMLRPQLREPELVKFARCFPLLNLAGGEDFD